MHLLPHRNLSPAPPRKDEHRACKYGGGERKGEVYGGEIKVMGDRAEDFRIFGHYG